MDKITFNINSTLVLYFVKFKIDDIMIFKIGQTNDITTRFKNMRHEFKIAGRIEVLKLLKITNSIIESQTLVYFRLKYPELKYDVTINNINKTECFKYSDLFLEELNDLAIKYEEETGQKEIKIEENELNNIYPFNSKSDKKIKTATHSAILSPLSVSLGVTTLYFSKKTP